MTAAQLDYATGQPIRCRKRIRRASLILALAIAIILAYRYGPGAYRQSKLLYTQHQCLIYAAPTDQIVYDENPGDRVNQPGYTHQPGFTQPVAMYIAPPFKNLSPTLPSLTATGATLFLHELQTPAGQRRLVLVQRHPVLFLAPTFKYPLGLEISVFEPATLKTQPKSLLDWRGGYCENPTEDLRFYAGQPDPNDPAHFTIRYNLKGQPGIIDAHLNNAGDAVTIKVRSGPAEGY